ncbi:MAG: NAD(P)/FAD-dependent oxidoreductase [Candidatus Izemoplasmatales bacterium]
MIYQAIIIGGGPAGLMAANVLSEHQVSFLLLEKNAQVGKKLLMTGGGRANVTNALSVSAFIDELDFKHKKFLYPALMKFGPKDVIDFFASKGLRLKLEPPIKYFPETGKSQSILNALLRSIPKNHIKLNQPVTDIIMDDDLFIIQTKDDRFQCKNIIIGTGSKSYPETGSNGDGNQFAKKFNIPIKNFTPAETSVYGCKDQIPFDKLKGAQIKDIPLLINGKKTPFRDDLLFTHFGLSGPLIFKASHRIYSAIQKGETYVSFPLTNLNQEEIKDYFEENKNQTKFVKNILSSILPNQLAIYLTEATHNQDKAFNTLTKQDIHQLIDLISDFKVKVSHVEDLKRAYVNAGGIDTLALNPNSFQVKQIKGMYFIGEAVDVYGPIGGFNITIALSSAYTAAKDIVKNI